MLGTIKLSYLLRAHPRFQLTFRGALLRGTVTRGFKCAKGTHCTESVQKSVDKAALRYRKGSNPIQCALRAGYGIGTQRELAGHDLAISDLVQIGLKGHRIKPPANKDLIFVEFRGTPSWEIGHKASVLRSRLEQIFQIELEILGGGYGCFWLYLGLGHLLPSKAKEISDILKGDQMQKLKSNFDLLQIRFIRSNQRQN